MNAVFPSDIHRLDPTMSFPSLTSQILVPASAHSKIRTSILAVALVDALGGPAEFHARFSFPYVTTMIPNETFGLPAGVWTDDTSMTLCLARSLSSCPESYSDAVDGTRKETPGFSEAHQLDRYVEWWKEGKLSAVDSCFDIGNTITRALFIWSSRLKDANSKHHRKNDNDHLAKAADVSAMERIRKELGSAQSCGNGSLMRVLPIGLAYYRLGTRRARELARRSSDATHPHPLCGESCELWTTLVVWIMQRAVPSAQNHAKNDSAKSKLHLLEVISEFPYTQQPLREALCLSTPLPTTRTLSDTEIEAHYRAHHPLLQPHGIDPEHAKTHSDLLPTEAALPSTGYVLHTLVAALYCFFATRTFEAGALMAVNLGSDADTVGAIYGGLAGCWYADDSSPPNTREFGSSGKGKNSKETSPPEVSNSKTAGEELFWSNLVRDWAKMLVRRELVEEVAGELVHYSALQFRDDR